MNDEKWLAEHYKALFDRQLAETRFYKALLYDAWKVIRGQAKGLKRQARKIKRLNAEIKAKRRETA